MKGRKPAQTNVGSMPPWLRNQRVRLCREARVWFGQAGLAEDRGDAEDAAELRAIGECFLLDALSIDCEWVA